MKRTVWIKLEIEGSDADKAFEVIDGLLDQGTPQDQINESGFDFEVTSATVHDLSTQHGRGSAGL